MDMPRTRVLDYSMTGGNRIFPSYISAGCGGNQNQHPLMIALRNLGALFLLPIHPERNGFGGEGTKG